MPNLIKFHGKHNYQGKEHLVLSSDDGTWLNSLPGFVPWGSFPKEMVKALGKRSDDDEALVAFMKSVSDYAGAVPTDVLNIHWVRLEDSTSWVKLSGSYILQHGFNKWIPSHWTGSHWTGRFLLSIPNSELPIFFGEGMKPVEATKPTKPRSEMSLFELVLEESREKGRQEDAARPANCAFKYL